MVDIAKLKHLVVVLQRVKQLNADDPKHTHFNWGDWVYSEGADPRENVCGTTACVAGWAMLDKTFNEQGLSFAVRKTGSFRCALLNGNEALPELAFSEFFKLLDVQNSFLCFGPASAGIDEAIRRVQWVIDHPRKNPFREGGIVNGCI